MLTSGANIPDISRALDLLDGYPPIAGRRVAEPSLRLAVGADAIDGIRAALDSRPAELEKSAQRGRLAQQH